MVRKVRDRCGDRCRRHSSDYQYETLLLPEHGKLSQAFRPLNVAYPSLRIPSSLVLVINVLPLGSKFIIFVFPMKMDLSPLMIVSLPAGTVLRFVRRGCWRDSAGGGGVPSLIPKGLLSRPPLCPAPAVPSG